MLMAIAVLHNLEIHQMDVMLEKHMGHIVLYLIQKHIAEYERIYFIHVRKHVSSESWKQRMRKHTLMQ